MKIYWCGGGGYKWRLRYKLGKKDSYYTIGDYPTIGLSEARKIAQEIRNLLLKGKEVTESELFRDIYSLYSTIYRQ
ncbi:Arm DNA-binding domain-containing protein [Lebetimonas sp. JS138]|uniref:Arm DNA-binding domain-containing protein n=1 Tax=Lebetimonas sp. JS138 TaxID=990072 RepID=UPI0009FDBCF3